MNIEINQSTPASIPLDATELARSGLERIDFRQRGATQNELFQFLKTELRANKSFGVEEEYPSVFGEFPGGQSIVLRDNGRIVCHACFVVREYQHANFRLKFGLIGSVVTHRDFRGLGLAAKLMREVIQELKFRGCVAAVLWSDQKDFYLPLGFQRAGREVDFRFSKDSVMDNTGTVREFDIHHDASLVWRLYQKHQGKVDRSLEEQKALCRIPNTKMFVTEKDGQMTSYICINKGADFEDYIHEWGGELYELQRNISHCQRYLFSEKPLTMIAPSFYDMGPIRQMAVERWEGVLGLVKLLDRPKMLAAYYSHLDKSQIKYGWDRDREKMTVAGETLPARTDLEVLTLCVGDESHLTHPVLPLFLWGFDSI